MPETDVETRTVLQLRTGTKIALMVAAVLLILGIHFYFLPVSLQRSDGGLFHCGTAMSPPSDSFQQSVCGDVWRGNLIRAYAAIAAALATAGLGFLFFGADRAVESRPARTSFDD